MSLVSCELRDRLRGCEILPYSELTIVPTYRTELHPHRDVNVDIMCLRFIQLTDALRDLQPTLLGLNRNAGQEICLRLLTDDLTGTRSYLDVRKVLLHELAHNRVSPQ